MCNIEVKDGIPSKDVKERLGVEDTILVLQQNRLQW